jgi:hypothetical protein
MPEIEIKTEGGESDPLSRRVGILAAVLAVILAIVTIASHRAHTMAVVEKTDANDKWSYYQSKRIKFHDLELGIDLFTQLGAGKPGVEDTVKRYEGEKTKYDKDAKEIEAEANKIELETRHTEDQALRYDIGEGMLEIGVVLASLYFIARRKIFPVVSVAFGVLGTAIAISGAFM